jgi:hypothetical protein
MVDRFSSVQQWPFGLSARRTGRGLRRGSARTKVEDKIVEVDEWDAIRFGKDTMRNVEAGPDGVDDLAFGAGGDPRDAEWCRNWWSD